MNGRSFQFTILDEGETRLDKYLATCLQEYSRSRLQVLIKDGRVTVNGVVERKTGAQVTAGDTVEVLVPANVPSVLQAEEIPLDIIFENNDLVIFDKPAGMVVHPAPGHSSGTLVHAALGKITDLEGIGGEIRPGIVHRLDKDTSGLIIVAKNEKSHRWLQDQFKLRKVYKSYIALVDGRPPTPEGRIEAAIARDPAHRKRMAIVSEGRGRAATTEYKTLKEYSDHTLIEAHPITGRTHQIRLHLAFLGCPVTGDSVYGKKKSTIEMDRHFLHAAKLKIRIPGEDVAREFTAPLPMELQKAIEELELERKQP